MKELVYVSQAVPTFTSYQINEMLEKARYFNKQHNITGVLLCDECYRFLQVLEGEDTVIDSLFTRIQNDMRHIAVLAVHEANIENRLFGEWSMAYKQDCPELSSQQWYVDLVAKQSCANAVRLANPARFIRQFYEDNR